MGVIQSWFPTFLYYDRLKKGSLARFNSELLKECYQVAERDRDGQKWSAENYPGGFTSYGSWASMHEMSSTFAQLKDLIDPHVAKFAKHLDFDVGHERRLEMTGCWINIVPRNVYHGLHLHPIATFSGTYYVTTPKGGGDFKIEDPRLSRMMAQPPRKSPCREHNKTFVRLRPESGKLVLFESWLRHEVMQNQCNEDRVSISFNYGWF